MVESLILKINFDDMGSNGNLQLEYNALNNAIPESWKQEMNNNSTQRESPKEIITEIGALNKLSNTKIRGFFDKKINHKICAVRFWKRKLNVSIEDYFTLASEYTKKTRLRLLHFKVIHNIYRTNILLKKMDIATSNQCLWCTETDYIEHAFYKCESLELFWQNVRQLILTK